MNCIKVQCPAKINLTLEVLNKREDGFHNIKSVMQMISLYDFLDIEVKENNKTEILLCGTSDEIPYNEKNLVYKAAKLFLEEAKIENVRIEIYIEKNIPISAGLAGGSTDAAGTLYGLNEVFNRPLNRYKLHTLCAQLGSDLNVCLEGGCILAESRGEKISKLKSASYPVSLIKPVKLGISAKEAYAKHSLKEGKMYCRMTDKMIDALNQGSEIREFLYNDLENAVFSDYIELQTIKQLVPDAVMSGSGSTYFVLRELEENPFGDDYQVISGLKFIEDGIGAKGKIESFAG